MYSWVIGFDVEPCFYHYNTPKIKSVCSLNVSLFNCKGYTFCTFLTCFFSDAWVFVRALYQAQHNMIWQIKYKSVCPWWLSFTMQFLWWFILHAFPEYIQDCQISDHFFGALSILQFSNDPYTVYTERERERESNSNRSINSYWFSTYLLPLYQWQF